MGNEQEAFAIRLARERLRRHWTLQQLAENVGVSERTVRNWEKGSEPGITNKGFLLKAFGMDTLDDIGRLASEAQTTFLQEDLSNAPLTTDNFQGRSQEIALLHTWIEQDQCRVIILLGAAGVGKTTLAAQFINTLHNKFQHIFWHSLQNAPSLDYVLKHCIEFISSQPYTDIPSNIEDQIKLLLRILQEKRCLIILDNVEAIMQPGTLAGNYSEGYENYGLLLRRFSEMKHQSCLLLTSREKPGEIVLLEGRHATTRSLIVPGLQPQEGEALLMEREIFGSKANWATFVELYRGNPLTLKLISETVENVFGGDISRFLQTSGVIVGDMTAVIEQQLGRITTHEQELLYWLAIERRPITREKLQQNLSRPLSDHEFVNALSSLRRRSLVEVVNAHTFSLQPVIQEHVIITLLHDLIRTFQSTHEDLWDQYALIQAQNSEHIKTSQTQFHIMPIVQHLHSTMRDAKIEEHLLDKIAYHREHGPISQGYLAGNVLNILIYLKRDMRGKNFAGVSIRQADLQNVALPEVDFTAAHFCDSTFSHTFGNTQVVTYNPQGNLLITGTATGEIWAYDAETKTPLYAYRGHKDGVWAIIFTPDGQSMISGGDDGRIIVWDMSTGHRRLSLVEDGPRVRALALHPSGQMLVSGCESNDTPLLLWDLESGRCIRTLAGHKDRVWSAAFSPDGNRLVTGGTDCTVRIWDVTTWDCIHVLMGHTQWVRTVAYHPNSPTFASCSDDGDVILWDSQIGTEITRLHGVHTSKVWALAFSKDGRYLATGNENSQICLWEPATSRCKIVLKGHSRCIRSVTFSPQDTILVSGADDQTVRFWNTKTGDLLKTLYGYSNRVWSALFTSDGKHIISCHEDRAIRIWDRASRRNVKTMPYPFHGVRAIALHPQGHLFASGGEDQHVHICDFATGRIKRELPGHTRWIRTLAFSNDGNILASGGEDGLIFLWSVTTGQLLGTLSGHTNWIRTLNFHSQLPYLVSGSDDGTVRLWNVLTYECLHIYIGHQGHVRGVVFHPSDASLISVGEDGTVRSWEITTQQQRILSHNPHWELSVAISTNGRDLATGGNNTTINLWETATGRHLFCLTEHSGRVRWVAFHPSEPLLVSSSDDGSIKLWDIETAQCVDTLICERPYENMHITHAQGLTDAQYLTLRLLGATDNNAPDFPPPEVSDFLH